MADMDLLVELARRIREHRERAGLNQAQIEERLILGPGWVAHFETPEGLSRIELSPLLALAEAMHLPMSELLEGLPSGGAAATAFRRSLYAVPSATGLEIHFDYGKFDATYFLPRASLTEFQHVIKTLRDGLAGLATSNIAAEEEALQITAIKSAAVEATFWEAMQTWPHANPTDVWGFVVARGYLDAFNHPATFARGDLGQSWKRTGGWALERILVTHYAPFLNRQGVRLYAPTPSHKDELLGQLRGRVNVRLEADKVDVLLTLHVGGKERCFGVVHVKNSFAERRTDDVDMSRALVEAGYVSPLWTMDCKSWPGSHPQHSGELGRPLPSPRSAKRVDIEDDRYFSRCFSYNRNTIRTPAEPPTRGRIEVCDFSSADDEFSRYIIGESKRFTEGAENIAQ